MGILSRLWSAVSGRSMENPRHQLDPWSQAFSDADGNVANSGVKVTRDKALTVSPLWRGTNLITRSVAKLPLGVYRNVHPGRERAPDHASDWRLRGQPSEGVTPFVWKQTLMGHVLLKGNGYSYIFRRADGGPLDLLILNPDRTYPVRENGKLWFVHELKGGEKRKLDANDVLHFKGLGFDGLTGYDVVSYMKHCLGQAIAQNTYGSIFFRNNARPNVVLQTPGKLSPEARRNLREGWERLNGGLDNSHKTAILEEGVTAVPLTINARDSQLIEGKQFSLIEVAHWLNIPPNRLGANVSTSYGSLEQENQNLLDDGIDPWLMMIEEECEQKLLSESQRRRGTHCISFDRSRLVRAQEKDRGEFYNKAIAAGWMSPDEARAREGMNPAPGGIGSILFRPLNLGVVGEDPDGTGPAVAPGATLLDLPDLRQEGDWDCGPAAVQSVCQFFGRGPATRQGYVEALGADPKRGTSPSAVVSLLSRLDGLKVTAAAALESEDLTRFFHAGQPILCPCRPDKTAASGHWVAVIGTGLGQVFLQDPALGRRMMSEEDWLAIWLDRDADGVGYERYGIAVGEELLSAPVETDEDDPEDDPAPGPAPDPEADARAARLREAIRQLVLDTARRMVRRVGTAAERAAKQPSRFLPWLDQIEVEHGQTVREALASPLAAWREVCGAEDGDAASRATLFLGDLRAGLLDVSGTATASQLAETVKVHMERVEGVVCDLPSLSVLKGGQ